MNKNKIFLSIFLFVLIFSIASVSASDVGEISDHQDFSSPQIQIRENINSLSLEKNCLEDSANSTLVQSSLEKTSTDTISSDSDKSGSGNSKTNADSDKSSSDKSASDKSNSDKSSSDNSKNNTDSGKSSSDKSTKVIDSKTNVSNNVSKNSTKIINSGSTIKKGKTYKITLKDANGKILSNKRIIFIFGSNKVKYIKTTDKNGIAYLTINAAAGKYTLKYSFLGDDSYSASSGSVNLKVQSKTTISGSGSTITKGNAYKVYLKDGNGNALANKQIIFTFGPNNSTYTRTTDSNGMVSLTINAAAGKTYALKYAFAGDDDYAAAEGSVNLKVQSKTTISGSGSTITKGNAYKVYLKDAEGNPLANMKITFTFGPDSTVYTRTTDSNGMVSLTINAAAGKTYALKYAFAGDDYYFASSGSVNLKVQSKTTISGSGSTITKGDSYKVYLKDGDGKALANKVIKFIFGPDSSTYTRTTDKNGMVSLTINAASGQTYKLIYLFAGDEYYLASNQTVNLKVNPPHGNQSQFKKGLNEIESLSDAELAKYLKSSGYDAITSAIQTLANKLTSGKTSTWDKATAIFNYGRDNIAYSYYSNSQKGAAKTLSSGTGNCCDQANLVVALCRAAGIPARFSHAKNCKFNSGLVAGHVWAQIYIDGVWYTADATSRYNELGNIQNWNTNSFTNLNQYIHLPF